MNAQAQSWRRPVLLAAVTALGIAIAGGLMTDTGPWYQSLRKPSWQPPGWLFGPVWTVIFALTASAAVIVWRRTAYDRDSRNFLLALFVLNGVLNLLWSFLFFYMRRPDWAFLDVMALWLSILAMIIYVWRETVVASLLLVPYLAWVTFAAVLNFVVMRLNMPFGS